MGQVQSAIISASRRTDIPAFYANWFMNRVRAGWCAVPSPYNSKILRYVPLDLHHVSGIVFWTKNPRPMLAHLEELESRGYRYYFLYSLNAYGSPLEPRLPPVEHRIGTFLHLARVLGPDRVIWRYDPIVISSRYSAEFHVQRFGALADRLAQSTHRVILSLVDLYGKTERRLDALERHGETRFSRDPVNHPDTQDMMHSIAVLARSHGLEVTTCAEKHDFTSVGIGKGKCVDEGVFNRTWSMGLRYRKDPGQRADCLCTASIDVGVNDTCLLGCEYCYATRSVSIAEERHKRHDPSQPALWAPQGARLRGAPQGEQSELWQYSAPTSISETDSERCGGC